MDLIMTWYTNSQEETQYTVDVINKSLPWTITWLGDNATVDIKTVYDNNGKKTTETAISIAMKKKMENGRSQKPGVNNIIYDHFFRISKRTGDTGAALSFYQPQGNIDHADTGKCVCPDFCGIISF
jgi:hypothetical protein